VNHKPKEIFYYSQWARAEAWKILPHYLSHQNLWVIVRALIGMRVRWRLLFLILVIGQAG